MLKIIKETYGDKLNQAYTKEGLFVEESVVLKIICNIQLKDFISWGIGDTFYHNFDDMLESIKSGVLKIYDNYDAIKLENACIICTELPEDYSFAKYVEAVDELQCRLKDDERCFFDPCLGSDFKILVLSPKEPLVKRKISNKNTLKPSTKEELKELVNDESIYLGDIDTSLIADMSGLFYDSKRTDFSGINDWDTSNVVNMSCMFLRCYGFNEELSFDTSCVVDMSFMFACCNFNNKLSFNTSNVRDMRGMFFISNFNQELDFNTSNVVNMNAMFAECESLETLPKFYLDFKGERI
ncbi:DUF285 domain-containing protein [Campylobacter sp. RM12651]|uniref:DUF285 domain-containing protein n=1 Tax=Campylobacter sp. RM12651 TaxID=1660079 RepID=UPI001EFB3F4D|nr:DUF285 domain-containing protein [Campylobacter sp. RM12651]ULO03934.1 DUF285 domain-containing protein [Campylobacter sp. RM12651]